MRSFAILCVGLVAAAGAVAWIFTNQLVNETNTIDTSTGPVLIGNQSILASLAEADAAAAAVHLAGADGDPEQQRLFESALARANVGLEDVARVVGDDEPSHDALAEIGSSITDYAARVEGARVRSVEGLPGASGELTQAISLLRDEISPQVVLVTERAQSRLDADLTAPYYWIALAAIVVAIIVLLIAQFWMTRKFSRLINPPLLISTLMLVGLGVWMGGSFFAQQSALDDADTGGYDAIQISAEIQSAAFEYRANETAAVINGVTADLGDLRFRLAEQATTTLDVSAAREGRVAGGGLLYDAAREADSARERAASAEMLERWSRYLATSEDLQAALGAGDLDGAADIVKGSSNSAFAGFNTSIEAALLDNRQQFTGSVDAASESLRNLRLAIAIATVLATLAAWWAFAIRLQEYR